jgi:hypothetical protein
VSHLNQPLPLSSPLPLPPELQTDGVSTALSPLALLTHAWAQQPSDFTADGIGLTVPPPAEFSTQRHEDALSLFLSVCRAMAAATPENTEGYEWACFRSLCIDYRRSRHPSSPSRLRVQDALARLVGSGQCVLVDLGSLTLLGVESRILLPRSDLRSTSRMERLVTMSISGATTQHEDSAEGAAAVASSHSDQQTCSSWWSRSFAELTPQLHVCSPIHPYCPNVTTLELRALPVPSVSLLLSGARQLRQLSLLDCDVPEDDGLINWQQQLVHRRPTDSRMTGCRVEATAKTQMQHHARRSSQAAAPLNRLLLTLAPVLHSLSHALRAAFVDAAMLLLRICTLFRWRGWWQTPPVGQTCASADPRHRLLPHLCLALSVLLLCMDYALAQALPLSESQAIVRNGVWWLLRCFGFTLCWLLIVQVTTTGGVWGAMERQTRLRRPHVRPLYTSLTPWDTALPSVFLLLWFPLPITMLIWSTRSVCTQLLASLLMRAWRSWPDSATGTQTTWRRRMADAIATIRWRTCGAYTLRFLCTRYVQLQLIFLLTFCWEAIRLTPVWPVDRRLFPPLVSWLWQPSLCAARFQRDKTSRALVTSLGSALTSQLALHGSFDNYVSSVQQAERAPWVYALEAGLQSMLGDAWWLVFVLQTWLEALLLTLLLSLAGRVADYAGNRRASRRLRELIAAAPAHTWCDKAWRCFFKLLYGIVRFSDAWYDGVGQITRW